MKPSLRAVRRRASPGPLRRPSWTVALLCGSVAIGCAAGDAPRSEAPSTLTILFQSDDYVLGPSRDDHPKFLMFEPLVRDHSGSVRPALAERWEHSPDFRTWTFHLRRDVRWHDGVPFTAHDVAFSLELFRRPEIALHGIALLVDSIVVPDEHTLVLSFSRPISQVPGWPVFYPRHLLTDLDPARFFDWEFWKHPVGNGPYRFVRGVPNTMLELEANDDYYDGTPTIDRVVLRLSSANTVTELRSGNVDAAYYVSAPEIAALDGDPTFRVYYQWVMWEPQAIHWNQRHPFLAHAAVRRALSHAIDRRELARLLYLPDEMPLVGGLSSAERALDLHREGKLDAGFDFDPRAARELLEQEGWVDRNGDGVREREGTEARFTLLARQGGILSTLEPALLLREQLRSVGVEMAIRPAETGIWYRLFRSGDFDATVHDIRNDPPDLLREDFFGDGTRIGYRNAEVVRLLEALTRELTPAGEDTLYASINAILGRDVPVTFLFPYFEAYAAHRRVRGLRTPDRAHPIGAIRELRIEDEGGQP
ncbi:MAG TPA: ABC transporter substrate-binding protein [Gemmatimonadota bacterium]|nr:ABC transporter substrate-binding protein [Gemmatimonadota bacterium]